MRGIVVAVMLVVSLSVSAAPAPWMKRSKPVSETLEGEWVLVQSEANAEGITMTMLIKGDRMTLRMKSGTESFESEMRYTLDPTKSPKQIDLHLLEERSNGMVQRRKEERAYGIYQLEGDRLTLNVKEKIDKRPTSFNEKSSGDQITLRRTKR